MTDETRGAAGETGGAEDTTRKPSIDAPTGTPPPHLAVDEVVVGDGRQAGRGDVVVVDYVGVAWSTGREFDSSWSRGEPFSFRLGARRVIAGWEQGVAGMRVGGRRRLTVPPHLGYGERGAGTVIAPGETLVFVVDLREAVAAD